MKHRNQQDGEEEETKNDDDDDYDLGSSLKLREKSSVW